MTTNYVNPTAGETILVKVSLDGGSTYVHPALINTSRGITYSLSTNTDEVVDMNNPSNPAVTVRSAKATDTKIDGQGMLDSNSVVSYVQLAQSGQAVPIKFMQSFANSTANALTITGNYFLTSFQVTGQRAQKATCTLTFEQAGPTSNAVS